MKTIGMLKDCSMDWESGKWNITFQVDQFNNEEIRALIDKTLDISALIHRNKRSLNANAYFHLLVGKIAEKVKLSVPEVKNHLLGLYGQREIDEEGKPLMISVYSDIPMSKREDIHTFPVGYTSLQGKDFTHYVVLRGSHTYNTKEMSTLIDGTVQEAKDYGIETLTPNELERMKALWNQS